jgi:enoyl-CoA hydratase/carnithine racemase
LRCHHHAEPQRNAVGDGMREELADAYRACDRDDGIRVLVLTGTPPAFCAGADLTSGERGRVSPRRESTFRPGRCPNR